MQPETPVAVESAPDELPDWLRAMQPVSPAATSVEADLASTPAAPRQPEAVTPEPAAEVVAPEVFAALEEASAEAMVAREAVAPEEPIEKAALATAALAAAVEAASPAEVLADTAPVESVPASWWVQTAADEDEEPLTELPPPVSLTVAKAAGRKPLPTAEREARRATGPLPTAASVNVDPLLQQLQADKSNHAVRLELARAWWSMGNRDSALEEYGKLINPTRPEEWPDEELEEADFTDAGPLADDIIADLERIVEIDEDAGWPRLLGDMYMKTGQLSRALDMYRRALSQL